ncbi:TVP38/TMEM64 family protein [Candidatus Methylobacter oryzae]|uniref:TVP38/TMEM64 family membrane protein n=1 Tax=Candidatus Methylobacter oryzae TaxID=2497749 RepID=A0ABY3CGZ7_9GAMM|nr:VTT domain-containing protein [Candidatus Methylobacter oryzae]TRX03315.1 TVP38/TMEM64 family protein [Candidatus Methylobacter oryzae]
MQQQDAGLIKKLTIALIFVGAVLLIGHELKLHLPDLEARIQNMGALAPLGFIVLFVALTPLFLSVDALCFAAGVLFPLGAGVFYIVIATYLASAVIFFLGRHLLRERILKYLAEHKRFSAINAIIKNDEFKLMFLLRLTPLPFALLGYAFSVTEARFQPYLAATSGILIYNISLVYFGYTAKHLSGLIGETARHNTVSYPLLAMGLVVSLAALIYAGKTAGEALKRLGYKG